MQPENCDLLEAWSFDVSGRGSPAIRAEYRRYLNEYGRDIGPLLEATTFTLRRFSAERTKRWSPSTLQIVRRAFRTFYGWAFAQKLTETNPAADLPPVKAPEVPVWVATADTRAKLIAACCPSRDRALVRVIFGSGARRCEVAALRMPDVDMAAGTISIVKSKTGKPPWLRTEWNQGQIAVPIPSSGPRPASCKVAATSEGTPWRLIVARLSIS